MITAGTIVGVAHDPGGARAILPVLDLLRKRNFRVLAVVSGPAVEIAEREFVDIQLECIEDSAALVWCLDKLAQCDCSAMISAAGANNEIEHTMRLSARKLGIPIVGVLDWWWRYRDRFQRTLPEGIVETSFPDWICAIDDISREGLIQDGFSPSQIVVTGAVNLESSLERLRRYSPQAAAIRTEIGLRPGERCSVFFSEPYIRASDGQPWGGKDGYFTPDGTSTSGYTAHGILKETIAALASRKPPHEELVLCVKPHPMEHVPSLSAIIGESDVPGIRVILVDQLDPVKLCAVGEIFFGMVSIILLEAALSGKPVFSVLIGHKSNSPNPSDYLRFAQQAYDRATLETGIEKWFTGQLPQFSSMDTIPIAGATQNIVDIVKECLSTGRPKDVSL